MRYFSAAHKCFVLSELWKTELGCWGPKVAQEIWLQVPTFPLRLRMFPLMQFTFLLSIFSPPFAPSLISIFSFPALKLCETGKHLHFAFFPFSHFSRARRPPSLTCLTMRRSLTEATARGRTRARTKPCSRKSRRRIWKPSASGKRPFSRLRSVTSSHHGFVSWKCRILALCLAQHDEGNAGLHCCRYSITKTREIIKCS